MLNHYTKYGAISSQSIVLNGSYSYTLIDLRRGVVYTYTDRFGSLKLYYSLCNRVLSLSSDIRPILALDCTLSLPNWSTVLTYLFRNYRYAYSTSSTFFDSIKSIPPATITGFLNNLTDVTSHSIKQNENVSSIDHISDEQAVNRFRDLLLEALEVRLTDTNDSEAYLLSGGLDSPTVAAISASRRESSNPINCYSLCFRIAVLIMMSSYDESPLIKEIVAQSNIHWHAVNVDSRGFCETYDEMLEFHDEPISSPTWYSHWKLLEAISNDGHKIIFGGDGGDHILAGLYDDFPYFFADLLSSNQLSTLDNELQSWIEMHSHPLFPKTFSLWDEYRDTCFDWNNPGQFHKCTWDESLFRSSHDYISLSPQSVPPVPLLKCYSNSYLISKLHQDLVSLPHHLAVNLRSRI